MLYLILVVAGLFLGLAVGRWWTLVAAVGIGVWVAVASEVDEVPPWFLGAAYAVLAASAIASGLSSVNGRACVGTRNRSGNACGRVAGSLALSTTAPQ